VTLEKELVKGDDGLFVGLAWDRKNSKRVENGC